MVTNVVMAILTIWCGGSIGERITTTMERFGESRSINLYGGGVGAVKGVHDVMEGDGNQRSDGDTDNNDAMGDDNVELRG